ncbi:hypothetical protein M427DRAFT_44271 [Gonapodya prolifera JEL478]|uniref:Uncharacterized protein n=1 Tax=Gonapodya prolifera (strain JEL478) TaxID=1344416 RepID=A0A139AGS3_GONPJ|nr:hypothetical protein M427DRAFT_44271 [Gonapodya prolifera JEL478]|eukprot:KXS15645.1 hypothetical protein M427DRAFT_44271 [Gonapodya prolifera JEL478]
MRFFSIPSFRGHRASAQGPQANKPNKQTPLTGFCKTGIASFHAIRPTRASRKGAADESSVSVAPKLTEQDQDSLDKATKSETAPGLFKSITKMIEMAGSALKKHPKQSVSIKRAGDGPQPVHGFQHGKVKDDDLPLTFYGASDIRDNEMSKKESIGVPGAENANTIESVIVTVSGMMHKGDSIAFRGVTISDSIRSITVMPSDVIEVATSTEMVKAVMNRTSKENTDHMSSINLGEVATTSTVLDMNSQDVINKAEPGVTRNELTPTGQIVIIGGEATQAQPCSSGCDSGNAVLLLCDQGVVYQNETEIRQSMKHEMSEDPPVSPQAAREPLLDMAWDLELFRTLRLDSSGRLVDPLTNVDYTPKVWQQVLYYLAESKDAKNGGPAPPVSAFATRGTVLGADCWVTSFGVDPSGVWEVKLAIHGDVTLEPFKSPFGATNLIGGLRQTSSDQDSIYSESENEISTVSDDTSSGSVIGSDADQDGLDQGSLSTVESPNFNDTLALATQSDELDDTRLSEDGCISADANAVENRKPLGWWIAENPVDLPVREKRSKQIEHQDSPTPLGGCTEGSEHEATTTLTAARVLEQARSKLEALRGRKVRPPGVRWSKSYNERRTEYMHCFHIKYKLPLSSVVPIEQLARRGGWRRTAMSSTLRLLNTLERQGKRILGLTSNQPVVPHFPAPMFGRRVAQLRTRFDDRQIRFPSHLLRR